MNLISFSALTAVLVTRHRNELYKLECAPNADATAGLFLQVHDFKPTAALSAPANGAVPKKWWPVDECRYKEFKNGEMPLVNGLYVCLSTTGPTKTLAVGGSDLFDYLHLELGFALPTYTAESIAADVVLAVWANNAGPQKLLRVRAQNLEAGVRYLQLHADATPANGDQPLLSRRLEANGDSAGKDSIEWSFGAEGRDVRQVVAGVELVGCSIVLSTTAETLTSASGSGANLYAEHR